MSGPVYPPEQGRHPPPSCNSFALNQPANHGQGIAPPPPPNLSVAGAGGRRMRVVKTKVCSDGLKEVPRRFEQCEVEDLIDLIASMFTRLMAHNDQIPLTPTGLTRFHSRSPPGISVREYLLRISRYTNVEPCCLLLLLHYVDRVCDRLASFTISSLTVHRFVIAGVAAGSKALSDSFCTNARYARVGGVTLAEMNLLEREFCVAIDYRLTTTGALLDRYYSQLVSAHPGYRLDPCSEPQPHEGDQPVHSAGPRFPTVDEPSCEDNGGLAVGGDFRAQEPTPDDDEQPHPSRDHQ